MNKYCASERLKSLSIISSVVISRHMAYLNGGKEPEGQDVLLWMLDAVCSEADLLATTASSTILKQASSLLKMARENVATGKLDEALRKISEATTRITTQADYALRKLEEKD
nr:hypothetical protein [Candidatus Freyrarchaeum guaymaensis]